MTLRRLIASAALTLGLVVATGAPAATAGLRVSGNRLVDGRGRGHVVQLRGVNRSGLEYACIQGWGFFDSPHPERIDDAAMIRAMLSWDINVVRIPLNEDCWLGFNTVAKREGTPYRRIVERYVAALHRAGLYVILDLHWAAPGGTKATGQTHMADADHTPAFWRSVATAFKHDHAVLFDLFNEPFGIGWNMLAARLPGPAGQRLPGVPHRRDAAARQRRSLDRRHPADHARRARLLRGRPRLARARAERPTSPARRLRAQLRHAGAVRQRVPGGDPGDATGTCRS